MAKISFFGGAQQVTGACYLLEEGATKILIDCGLFQCPRFCEKQNGEEFPFNPADIDAVFITHGHIDHIGRVPKLARDGFRGKIYSTEPTQEFAAIMLEDSLGVLEKEARREGEEVFYSENDIARVLAAWEGKPYHERISVGSFTVTIKNAGHILGSAIYEVDIAGAAPTRIVFTGDLGNSPAPLLQPVEYVKGAHYLVIESVYGDRVHENVTERKKKLEQVIEDTVASGGTLMIPVFSLERTQELLFEMNELVENKRIPRVPIFLDSPLAIKATAVYHKHGDLFNKAARTLIKAGDDLFRFPDLQFTEATEESKSINAVPAPKVIIAGAGMMQGGRITHHAKRYLPDPKSTILFIGYQAAGSLGRRIFDGADKVTIHGETIPVRAKVAAIGGYSAHADSDALFEFVVHTEDTLKHVYAVQGEPASALYLAQRIKDNLGIAATAPKYGDSSPLP